ncbi:hypothetical protein QTJ16_000707 [Diplocarpon rosae]|uniref:UBC core domain-containing protein n=1 Tax=Diplocarpon rosae TaxID=946125 RepID=A0AAD9T6V8_9HELO|nr:hypothetical protein QTJ16_000707 [Diplocarpon rosae]
MSTSEVVNMGSSSSKPQTGRDGTQQSQAIEDLQRTCARFAKICAHPGCEIRLTCSDLDDLVTTWSEGAQEIPPTTQLSISACGKGHLTCVGCGKPPKLDPNKSFFTPLGVVNHCCDYGRIYTIYLLLARFDAYKSRRELACRAKNAEQKLKSTKSKFKSKTKAKKSPVAGVGYGTHTGDYGVLDDDEDDEIYGNPYLAAHQRFQEIDSNDEERADEQMTQDFLTSDTCRLLGVCLPDQNSEAVIELNMLRMSTLLDTVTEMVRNDSIVDITERFDVYQGVVAFIEKLASHRELVVLLFEERYISMDHPGIKVLGDGGTYEPQETSRSAPLISSYGNTHIQAKTFLEMTQKSKTKTHSAVESWQSKESLILLKRVVHCFELLDTIASEAKPATNVVAKTENIWSEFAQANNLTFTDEVLLSHRYERDFNAVIASNRGRLNTISKELATLKTSLPPGIFLKVAESRSDVMKVLIIGSEGSPYAGGLFTFDLFLDSRYPLSPPKMTFTLNGNDADGESLNPNLHLGSGTVCLSLLNTWPGHPSEAWQPGKSTILSVLVSVQAMILGAPLPWENEPGHEGSGRTPRVLAHKSRVQSRTIRFGMIAWLENKFEIQTKELIWKEICQTYWKHNGEKVMGYVKEWVNETPGLLSYGKTDYWSRISAIHQPHASVMAGAETVHNLVERLSALLNIEYNPVEFESQMQSALAKTKRKSIAPRAGPAKTLLKMLKKKKSKAEAPAGSSSATSWVPSATNVWVYTGLRNVKTVKKACQDFQIAYNGTIQASIERLERDVNRHDFHQHPETMEVWGEMKYVEAKPPTSGYSFSADPEQAVSNLVLALDKGALSANEMENMLSNLAGHQPSQATFHSMFSGPSVGSHSSVGLGPSGSALQGLGASVSDPIVYDDDDFLDEDDMKSYDET